MSTPPTHHKSPREAQLLMLHATKSINLLKIKRKILTPSKNKKIKGARRNKRRRVYG
jgi:hypothetical protein